VKHAAIRAQQLAVRRDPGIEQAGRLQRGFEPGAVRCIDVVAELDQLPQRRAGEINANTRIPRVRSRRDSIFACFETPAFVSGESGEKITP